MTTCGHTRRRLSERVHDARVEEHLADCSSCRTYADALDTVRHHAPGLVPGPPEDLLARVHEDLGMRPPAAAGPAGAPAWRRSIRRTPVGMVAAVVGALLGFVVVVALTASPTTTDDAAATLATVASSHAGQGTSFAFDVAGDVELRLPSGASTPGRDQLAAELDRLAGGTGDRAGPIGPVREAAQVTLEYRARGATDGHGALTYELRWRVGAAARADGSMEVLTVDERSWVRTAATTDWVLVDDTVGFDLGVAEVPHHLGEVLAMLDDVEEAGTLGVVRLDGEPVERLRARTTERLVVDAWVDEEHGWLRRLRWLPPPPADERDGTTHGGVVVRLRDHGRTRSIDVPHEWRTLDELAADEWPPFHPGAMDRGAMESGATD